MNEILFMIGDLPVRTVFCAESALVRCALLLLIHCDR